MKSRNKRYRTYYKYLISYVVVFIIPIIAFTLFVHIYFVGILRRGIRDTNYEQLAKSVEIIDTELRQVENWAAQLEQDPIMWPFDLKNDPKRGMEIVDNLRDIEAGSTFIEEIFVSHLGKAYIYSTSSSYHINVIRRVLRPESSETVTVDELLFKQSRMQSQVFLYGEEYLSLTYPLMLSETAHIGNVTFLVSQSRLERRILFAHQQYNHHTFIVDGQFRVVASINSAVLPDSTELIENLKAVLHRRTEKVDMAGETYHTYLLESPQSGWIFYSLVPSRVATRQVWRIWRVLALALVLILVVGGILIYYDMNLIYDPVRRLLSIASRLSPDTADVRPDLKTVSETMSSLADEKRNLIDEIISNRTPIKQYMLQQIIKGDVGTLDRMNDSGMSMQVHLRGVAYCAAIFHAKLVENGREGGISGCIQYIEQYDYRHVRGYGKESDKPDQLIFVFASESNDNKQVADDLDCVRSSMASECVAEVTVAMGGLYSDLGDVGRSYIEAATALNYRFVEGGGRIIAFHDIAENHTRYGEIPRIDVERLREAIIRGDSGKIKRCLDDIIHCIAHLHTPLFIAKCLCFDVINTILKAAYDLSDDIREINLGIPDLYAIGDFETVDQLSQILTSMADSICHAIERHSASKLISDIKDYIRDHHKSAYFSVNEIAAEFGMSTSTLGRTFKRQTGRTVSQYVSAIKMDAAATLLSGSEKTIQEIVSEIGYSDASSFIRKFRTYYGVTPQIYRSMNT